MSVLNFLDVNKFTKGLKPVTSTELFTRAGDFTVDSLFSESIFGPIGTSDRKKSFSYIDISTKVIHPSVYRILYRLDRKIEKFISTELSFSVTEDGLLIEDSKGVTGVINFIKVFPQIKWRGDTKERDRFIELIYESYKRDLIFIDRIPVIPPDLRPAYQDDHGNWRIDELNGIYLTILRRSKQLKSAKGSGPLYDLLNYGLQMSVIDHDNYIRTRIQKKHGLIRDELLSKRVDFSARAVITPGPDLKMNEIGLPLRIAATIFEPFLLHFLLYSNDVNRTLVAKEIKEYNGLDLSVDSIQRVIKAIRNGDKISDGLLKIFFDVTKMAMEGRVILAKRDPAINQLSIRAFYPKLILGDTIQLCTLQVGGFNADFDGDQMAIYHPLTKEAQEEAKKRMMRPQTGSSKRLISFKLSKEMCVGLYVMTKLSTSKKSPISVTEVDFEQATDPYIPVIYKKNVTTMGRAIFNWCLPSGYPFINELITGSKANDILLELVKTRDPGIAEETANRMKNYAFKFSTLMSPSFGLDEIIQIPDEIYELKKTLATSSTEESIDIIKKMKSILINHLKGTGFYDLIESGSARGWDQPVQILVTKGIITDTQGNVLSPIQDSFSDGLTNKEYFLAAAGARSGLMDRVLNTATTGYMSRKLAYVLNSVELDIFKKDCGVKRFLNITLTSDIIPKLEGRTVFRNEAYEIFNKKNFDIGELIAIRSPIYCSSYKICHACYGTLLSSHKSPYIGILAGQLIGERGTQLIMKTFHTGGAAEIEKRDVLLDISGNDPIVSIKTIRNKLSQVSGDILCSNKCYLSLDLSYYKIGDNLLIDDQKNIISVNSLVSKYEDEDSVIQIILDYPVEINAANYKIIGKEKIEIEYEKGSTLLTVQLDKTNLKEMTRYVERLLTGKEIFKDVDHLFKKLYKVYGPIGKDIDIVHYEVLLGQILRYRLDPTIPARLAPKWDPILMNFRKTVFNSGFIQGIAFESINEAINSGLIQEREIPMSILEKVLTGTLIEEK